MAAQSRPPAGSGPAPTAGAGPLVAAAALGAAAALWALFLWQQLVVARGGGDPYCALGGGGCAALWDGGFANAVQSATGVPVAGWGFVWGLVAAALALAAALRLRGGRSPAVAFAGALVTAAAGLVGVAVLGSVSLSEGGLCTNCLVTYALTLAYGVALLPAVRRLPPPPLLPGAAVAALAVALGFGLALPVGLRTPSAQDAFGAGALPEAAARPAPDAALPQAPDAGRPQAPEAGSAPEASPGDVDRAGPGPWLEGLEASQRQLVADLLALWKQAEPVPGLDPRPLYGEAFAPVRATTFTDASCSHCARFHEGLVALMERLPPGRLALESRMFPLEGACNPQVRPAGHPERCAVARARLCIAGEPGALEAENALFRNYADLSEELLFRVTRDVMPEAALRACMESPRIQEQIETDIRLAMASGIRGTPHLLVNGRPVPAQLPLLAALALASGDADHPAFASLPAPRAGVWGGPDH